MRSREQRRTTGSWWSRLRGGVAVAAVAVGVAVAGWQWEGWNGEVVASILSGRRAWEDGY
jgi:hypothetical protein